MNLTVSNFAWDFDNIEQVSKTLKENGINHIELVFPKYKSWDKLSDSELFKLKELLNSHGLITTSTQSLFYGIDCKSIISESEKFIKHFETLIKYSKILGIEVLVFGSPGLRKTNNISNSNLHETFMTIDKMLDGTGIILCIEPNSSVYGGDFFYTIKEIVHFLKTFKFRNIFTMCDTHNSWLENEDPNEELLEHFQYIKHIHISEPNLSIITDIKNHQKFSNTIKKLEYNNLITYEVLNSENTLDSIQVFSSLYSSF